MSVGGNVSKKQWTTEEICTLIDAFSEHRNLWQTIDANYKNRIKKMVHTKKLPYCLTPTGWKLIEKLKT